MVKTEKKQLNKISLVQTEIQNYRTFYFKSGGNMVMQWLIKQLNEHYCLLVCVDGHLPSNYRTREYAKQKLHTQRTEKGFLIIHPGSVTQALNLIESCPENAFYTAKNKFKDEHITKKYEGYVDFLTDSLEENDPFFSRIINKIDAIESETYISIGSSGILFIVTKDYNLSNGLASWLANQGINKE